MAHVGVLSAALLPNQAFSLLLSAARRAPNPDALILSRSPMSALSDDPIRRWILTEGKATHITRTSPIWRGCINHASRYDTDPGSFFVKTNRHAVFQNPVQEKIGTSMFEGEALGLRAMYDTKSIRVPMPSKVGPLPTGGSFIIMEFIEFGRPSMRSQSVLGRKLAEMHKAANTIGSGSQKPRDFSLHPSSKLYRNYITLSSCCQRLLKNMGALFKGVVIESCLLHGDLWSGNISSDNNGDPVLLDPACYYDHNEAEFGMSCCAGFGRSFYYSYFEVMPKQPGFENRRDLYMLYHYLIHYNLFGSGYRSPAMLI